MKPLYPNPMKNNVYLTLVLTALIFACSSDNDMDKKPDTSDVPTTGIEVTPETLSIDEGGSGSLSATVSPADATDKNVTWSSASENIATVDANGVVTAVSAGTVTISATSATSSDIHDTSEITVTTADITEGKWRIEANFEDGTLGEEAQGNSTSFSDAFSNTKYSNVQVRSGSQSAEVGIDAGETGFGQWGGSFNFPSVLREGDEIWFRTYLYFPDGFPFTTDSGRLKTMRIHTASSSGDNEGYIGLLISDTGNYISVGSEVTNEWYRNNRDWREKGGPTATGQWQALEQYIKFSSVPGEAVTRVWQNGVLIMEDTITNTLHSATSVSDFIYLFTYWNGGAPASVKAYVDDVIITSATPSNTDAEGNPFIGL